MENNVLENMGLYSSFEANMTLKNPVSTETYMFCKEPFWNSTITWNTTDTECFRDVILQGVPCGFLWIIGLPLWLWKVTHPTFTPNGRMGDISSRPRLKGREFY